MKTEKEIIYTLVLDIETPVIMEHLLPHHFEDLTYREIFRKALTLFQKKSFTPATLQDECPKVVDFLNDDISALSGKKLLKAITYLKNHYVKRELSYRVHDMSLDEVSKLLQESFVEEKAEITAANISESIAQAIAADITKIPFPFTSLNHILGGLRKGEYTIIASRPSVGKSAFLEQVFWEATKTGKKVLFVSIEMSEDTIFKRYILRTHGVDLLKTDVDGQKKAELYQTVVDGLGSSVLATGAHSLPAIEKLIKKHAPDIVLIDYLQIVTFGSSKMNDFERATAISNGLRNLRSEYPISLVAASQLSRAGTGQPELSHLRSSGQIEQDADVVLTLYRKSDDESELLDGRKIYVDCLKNRNGITFGNTDSYEFALYFNPKKVAFFDMVGGEYNAD